MKLSFRPLITLSAAALALCGSSFAADYNIDASHSMVGFQVRHLFSKVSGKFKDFEGSYTFDTAHPEKSKVKVTAKSASIDTANAKRDDHLKGPDFFDVAKMPTLGFESTKVSPAGDKKFKLEGNLTIHGVTKPVAFDMEFLGSDKDPWGGTRSSFVATTKINRKDYGLTWNKTLESGNLLVGEEVTINIEIEGLQKK
jgi:polyisoprenoid-binding protein YceI